MSRIKNSSPTPRLSEKTLLDGFLNASDLDEDDPHQHEHHPGEKQHPQILLAVTTFSVVSAVPAALPWMIGFASGALVYLVLTELLPSSYQNGRHSHVSLLVSFSAGGVVLLEGLLK